MRAVTHPDTPGQPILLGPGPLPPPQKGLQPSAPSGSSSPKEPSTITMWTHGSGSSEGISVGKPSAPVSHFPLRGASGGVWAQNRASGRWRHSHLIAGELGVTLGF